MPDEPQRRQDAGAVWREQPPETRTVQVEQLMNRRARELDTSTRAEIGMSILAALFFAAVIAWRLRSDHDRLTRLGLIAVVLWVLISLYHFRHRIWRKRSRSRDQLAVTGLEHYRRELQMRRDHLRNAWLWHGPLILACVVLAMVIAGRSFAGSERLPAVLPLLVLLAAWIGYGIRRRWLLAREVQREIDDLERKPGDTP